MTTSQKDRRYTDTSEKVADLLAKGMTVLEIARHLNISPQAVYGQIDRHGLQRPTEKT